MKKWITGAGLLFLLTLSLSSFAQQTYEVPVNYTLVAADDYPKYEADVIKTVDWLQQNPWTANEAKAKQANTFLIAWLTGTKAVTLNIDKPLIDLTDKNPPLLVIFMGQFAKYTLEHKDNTDPRAANEAALKAMAEKYEQEPSRQKNSKMEEMIKANKNGKLNSWMKENFYKS
ncbi:hypothetical protein D0C36_06785 [Mucilaginibacter conchicola]|uniref:Uncharacterized protein n=1 Tax=Mucilaginibacter conchicola TaxID=2303333 RepID=A0A372NYN2_9SPHI|nr:hypothetical protein [Mucilaginibacter conchicola]RFZ95226.1 hypothetical protein D0C36_06785 [Mucilaginibacter conchicola]